MRLEAIGRPFRYTWPGGSVYLEPGNPIELDDARAQRLLAKAPGKVRVLPPSIRAGNRIEWQRAGQIQHAVVDFLHIDPDGATWAFVTIGESWAAVNCKFAKGVAQ